MSEYRSYGARMRLGRLGENGRLMIVPLDHSVSNGPIQADGSLDRLVADLGKAGVDAVVLHKGTVRHVDPSRFLDTSLIIHLSASTAHAPDPDAKHLVCTAEAALRLGADAVSVHVNLGCREEARQLVDLGHVAESCERWSIPLLAMMYPRGPQVDDPADPELLAHAAVLAADLGADMVKIPHPRTEHELADLVRACPIPLVTAGGAPVDNRGELLEHVSATMRAGAAGVAMGRNIFQSEHPGDEARHVADVLHAGESTDLRPQMALTPG